MSFENTTSEYSLEFNPTNYTTKTLTVDDQTITYRAYENIVYVKYPVDTNYEIMNIYVPEEYYEGKSIGNYTAETAPIFMPNMVGGYMPGAQETPGTSMRNSGPNATFVALSKGYVVAAPAVRGRSLTDTNGNYTGKAPALIVDLKAAVRYLRYNDKKMPGDVEKIISDGTSAGGALSSLIGATGNNNDYEPYLNALGAANAKDDIFAAAVYCPIANLDNADKAYEWMYNGINTYNAFTGPGTLTTNQITISGELKAVFPAYLNSLGLRNSNGTPLTLDSSGNGTFKDYVKSFVIASAQKAYNSGTSLSGFTWITMQNGTVTDIDWDKYVAHVGRMKTPPAFDALDLSCPENIEFGTATINAKHFTEFGQDNNTVSGASLADAHIVKMLNPMYYIGDPQTTTAKHWRIRWGEIDSNTSLAIPAILAAKLQNNGFDVDFAVPWATGHAGDYDLDELFAWIGKICGS
jgi:hypothetical protein